MERGCVVGGDERGGGVGKDVDWKWILEKEVVR